MSTQPSIKSNTSGHYASTIFMVILGLVFISSSFFIEEPESGFEILGPVIIGVIFILVSIYYWFNHHLAEITDEGIKLSAGSKSMQVRWNEIEEVRISALVNGDVIRIRLKNGKSYTIEPDGEPFSLKRWNPEKSEMWKVLQDRIGQ